MIDQQTLGFADFSGNRQYVTLGNLSENPKAFIFLMDYANSRRVQLWGTTRVIEDDAELLQRLRDPLYPGNVERACALDRPPYLFAAHTRLPTVTQAGSLFT